MAYLRFFMLPIASGKCVRQLTANLRILKFFNPPMASGNLEIYNIQIKRNFKLVCCLLSRLIELRKMKITANKNNKKFYTCHNNQKLFPVFIYI